MSKRLLFLLLLPVLVSFAPPRKIPDPLRNENASFSPPFGIPGTLRYVSASGDVLELTPGRGKTRCVFMELQENEDACRERLSGSTKKVKNNRYCFDAENVTLYLKVSARKVEITGTNGGCGSFESVYRRQEPSHD